MLFTQPLVTPRLLLREFEQEDWRLTHVYEADPEVVRYGSHDVLTPEASQQRVRESMALARETPRRVYDLAVVLREEGRLIGRCGLRITDEANRQAMLWYILDRSRWGQGYGTEAAGGLAHFAFGTLGMHRLWADCDPRNPGSSRVMEKLGMRREGLLRETMFLKGEWCDSLLYGLLAHEWRARV